MHTVVGGQIERVGDRECQRPHRSGGVVDAGAREREHRSVMVAVDVQIEQRGPARGRERVEDTPVASFRHVRHAFDHPVILVCEGGK